MMCSHTRLEILSSPRASQTERTSRSPPAESRLCRVATGEYKHSKPTCKYVHTGVPVTTPGTGSNHPKNSEPSKSPYVVDSLLKNKKKTRKYRSKTTVFVYHFFSISLHPSIFDTMIINIIKESTRLQQQLDLAYDCVIFCNVWKTYTDIKNQSPSRLHTCSASPLSHLPM